MGALDPEDTASGPPAPESAAVTAGTEPAPAEASKSQRRSHSPKNHASDESSGGEEKHTVHAQRLGIDLPLDPQDEELVFQASRIFKIENLERLKKLRQLALIANEVETIEGLEAQGSSLQQLELYQNHIKRIDNVQHLTSLRVLDLSFNKIRRIENLETLVNLQELFLSSNKISKIEGLSSLKNLKMLELGSNRIRVIEGIEDLTQLTDLWLGKNKITQMSLPPLPELQRLSLQSNRLESWDLSFFSKCPKLQELYLSHNNLPSPPQEIEQQAGLRVLDLGCNRVSELESVCSLSHLQDLWLNDNQLTNMSQCRCLARLPALETLYLERNPLQADLGPAYRQAIMDLLPRLSQLDALLLHASINVVRHPEKNEAPVKPIMRR